MCGITGFHPKKDKKANLGKLLVMGIMNEERGTDSTGMSIGSKLFKGSDPIDRKARDFIIKNIKDIKKENLVNQNIIIHTRKSTNGLLNKDNTHPFHYYDGKNENNYKNLLMLNWKNILTIDSHYMIAAAYETFYNNLKEERLFSYYEGGAALIYYNKDEFKVWKGANNNVEERPMYYIETEEGWYFNSLKEALSFAFLDKIDNIVKVKNNELITIKNDVLSSKIIPRNIQTVISTTTYPSYSSGFYNNGSYKTDFSKAYNVNSITTSLTVDNDFKYKDNVSRKIISGIKWANEEKLKNDFGYNVSERKTEFYSVPIRFEDGVILRNYKLYKKLKNIWRLKYFNKEVYQFYTDNYQMLNDVIEDFIVFSKHTLPFAVFYRTKNDQIEYSLIDEVETILLPTRFGSRSIRIANDNNIRRFVKLY